MGLVSQDQELYESVMRDSQQQSLHEDHLMLRDSSQTSQDPSPMGHHRDFLGSSQDLYEDAMGL